MGSLQVSECLSGGPKSSAGRMLVQPASTSIICFLFQRFYHFLSFIYIFPLLFKYSLRSSSRRSSLVNFASFGVSSLFFLCCQNGSPPPQSSDYPIRMRTRCELSNNRQIVQASSCITNSPTVSDSVNFTPSFSRQLFASPHTL